MTRDISSSRPTTGSSLFSSDAFVSERVYLSRARNFFDSAAGAFFWLRISVSARSIASRVMRKRASRSRTEPGMSMIAIKRCSVETNSSCSSVATLALRSSACTSSGVKYN